MNDTPASAERAALRLDRRRHAYRDDLAAASLKGKVDASTFADGIEKQTIRAALGLRRQPKSSFGLETEALFGERVTVFDEADGWAWVQLARDGYVGYVPADGLTTAIEASTHRVSSISTFIYAEPDIKSAPLLHLSLNCEVSVMDVRDRFAALMRGGFVMAHHIAPIDQTMRDFVAVAERFERTPYLWGGKTRIGTDCSGLVQNALTAAGIACPRDTDMQEAEVGSPVDFDGDIAALADDVLKRGDLIFWKGHVGVMVDGVMLLHANGHHMSTVVEPLVEAAQRIERQTGDKVRTIKRLDRLGGESQP